MKIFDIDKLISDLIVFFLFIGIIVNFFVFINLFIFIFFFEDVLLLM